MNRKKLRIEEANKADELITVPDRGEMEERLAYLNIDETEANEYKHFLMALILLVGIVVLGCGEQGEEKKSIGQLMISSHHQEVCDGPVDAYSLNCIAAW